MTDLTPEQEVMLIQYNLARIAWEHDPVLTPFTTRNRNDTTTPDHST